MRFNRYITWPMSLEKMTSTILVMKRLESHEITLFLSSFSSILLSVGIGGYL